MSGNGPPSNYALERKIEKVIADVDLLRLTIDLHSKHIATEREQISGEIQMIRRVLIKAAVSISASSVLLAISLSKMLS